MFVLRIVAWFTAFLIASGVVAYLFTGDRRYLASSWKIARYAALLVFVVMALMLLEWVAVIL